jgi:capsid protein
MAITIANRLRSAWQRARRFVNARYEAAVNYFGERSLLWAPLQDARFDVDKATREEICRKHRYWVKNSSIVQRIRNLFIQFSVGATGLQCVPNSADEEWNERRGDSWEVFCRQPEISSRLNMTELCIQWAGSLFDDGGIFVVKLQDARFPTVRPLIQTIEAHRCQTPPHLKEQEGKTIIDGIEVNSNMRPVAYWFIDDAVSGSPFLSIVKEHTYKRIPAEMVIHKFKSRRPGMMRELPEGFACLNTLHDYEDLHKLELQAAKKLASRVDVVTNTAGEANAQGLMQDRRVAGANSDRPAYYQNILGASTVYAKNGEKVEQFAIDRPSIAVQSYWDLKLSEICCGYNVPKLLVVPYSLQGTVTRADLDVCTGAFRANFEIIASLLREIYEWQTEWAVRYDSTMRGKPPEQYTAVVIRPPRAPNVDIGYRADALIKELEAGTLTHQDVFAERQQDWRHQTRQSAEFMFFVKKLAKEYSEKEPGITISPEEIAKKLQGTIKVEAEEETKAQPSTESAGTAATA